MNIDHNYIRFLINLNAVIITAVGLLLMGVTYTLEAKNPKRKVSDMFKGWEGFLWAIYLSYSITGAAGSYFYILFLRQ